VDLREGFVIGRKAFIALVGVGILAAMPAASAAQSSSTNYTGTT
jgi:hypothetical protein